MKLDLKELLKDAECAEALANLCDLEPGIDGDLPAWFTVDGSSDITVLARDGTGGLFVTVAPSPRVIYAGSEGNSGVIGGSVDEFVALIVTCPYWADLLKYSDGGKLDEMRRAQPVLEASWLDDNDENEDLRKYLLEELDLIPPDDPVGVLHANAAATVVIAHVQDGSPAPSLFNSFTIDQNPFLKPYMT